MTLLPDTLLDRAAEVRTDSAALERARADPAGLYVPLWRNRSLMARTDPPKPVALSRAQAEPLFARAESVVFLGRLGEQPCFSLGLPGGERFDHLEGDFNDLRMVGPTLPAGQARLLAYARSITAWHRHQRCCGRCGARLEPREGGHVRLCPACETRHFPRTDPAIMALVRRGDRILLARQPAFPPKMVSVLAGFVEPGESLEEAAVREVREEVGLEVRDLRYLRSQPWPFPASLMVGLVMDSDAGDIVLHDEELEHAAWYDRAQIRDESLFVPPRFSLAGQLIGLFLEGAL